MAPRAQARGQAAALREKVKELTGIDTWVRSCVFYSHPESALFVEPHGSNATPALDHRSLRRYLKWLEGLEPTSVLMESVAPALSALATDSIGFGDYAGTWRSVLDRE